MILQKLKWFALIFAVGIAGTLLFFSFRQKATFVFERSDSSTTSTVALHIDFGDGNEQNFSSIPYVTGQTAFSILEDARVPLVYDPSTGVGVFVRQIGDKKNGDGGRYWQYWVNEKFALVAADQYALSASDRVEWKFVVQQGQ